MLTHGLMNKYLLARGLMTSFVGTPGLLCATGNVGILIVNNGEESGINPVYSRLVCSRKNADEFNN